MSPDTERVGWVVDALSDEYTATVTTEVSDILEQFDPETDIVLIDTVSDGAVVDALSRGGAESEYEYQLGVLADSQQSKDFDADAVIPRSLSADNIQERVDWLGARARYCKTLSQYYEVTRELVERQCSDCRSAECGRLRARRDRLESRLDEIGESLDSKTLYDAVLG